MTKVIPKIFHQIGKLSQLWAVDGKCQFLNKLGFTLAVHNKKIYKQNQPLDAWVRVNRDFNCWKLDRVGTSMRGQVLAAYKIQAI